MNIYQKLIEVRKEVPYLKKENKGYSFNFVSSSQALASLKSKMDELQLLLVPSVAGHEVSDHTTAKGGHEYFTVVQMIFTWINAEKPEETIVCPWLGQGLDSGEKGVGKAMTYAEKYFMLKFFNIPTDKDDPDAFQKKNKPKQLKQDPPIPEKSGLDKMVDGIDWFITNNKAPHDLEAWLEGKKDFITYLNDIDQKKVAGYARDVKAVLAEKSEKQGPALNLNTK